jgi:pyruvate dehydrogenase E1 component
VRRRGSCAGCTCCVAGADLLQEDFGVSADIWSVPSFTELRREGLEADRWNLLHPGEEERVPWVQASLEGRSGPVVAATDYMRAFADQIRPWVSAPYRVLGTDGYGRSDYRKALRSFFEVDRHHVVLAALTELARAGEVDATAPKKAIETYGIDTERPAPWTV